jgi:hypothetical protein
MNNFPLEGFLMNEIIDVDGLARQTRRRGLDDGLYDLYFGTFFLIWGSILGLMFSEIGVRWYARAMMMNRAITIIGEIMLFLVLILGIYGGRKIIERIRYEVLWKDTGYVKPLHIQVPWIVNLLASAVMLTMIIGVAWFVYRGVYTCEIATRAIVAGAGVGTGVVFFGMGVSLRLQRYITVGFAGGLFSAALLLPPISFSISWILLGIGWGVVLLTSGSVALHQTLKSLREASNG